METENMKDPIISERAIDEPKPLKVIYIGAGVSGILAAIQFPKHVPGIELAIYDKNPDIGGTWFENR
jgi:cation diffusion facilitator CzcD-associated flavoprotein CzcO